MMLSQMIVKKKKMVNKNLKKMMNLNKVLMYQTFGTLLMIPQLQLMMISQLIKMPWMFPKIRLQRKQKLVNQSRSMLKTKKK